MTATRDDRRSLDNYLDEIKAYARSYNVQFGSSPSPVRGGSRSPPSLLSGNEAARFQQDQADVIHFINQTGFRQQYLDEISRMEPTQANRYALDEYLQTLRAVAREYNVQFGSSPSPVRSGSRSPADSPTARNNASPTRTPTRSPPSPVRSNASPTRSPPSPVRSGSRSPAELPVLSNPFASFNQEYGIPGVPPQPPAVDTSYRDRGFYKQSVKKLRALMDHDIFTWLCIQSYMTSPFINTILFKVNGDLTKFDQRFMDIKNEKLNIAEAINPNDPYNIFDTFFKNALTRAVGLGKPLLDPDNSNYVVTTQADLVRAYPAMKAPLTMKDKAAFLKKYVLAIQTAITGLPAVKRPVITWRGYAPLNLPHTLALDARQLQLGEEITNWAFMSVSFDIRISSMFVNRDAMCCTLRITIPAGFPAFMISSDSSDKKFPPSLTPWTEQEILLPAGCVFKVLGKAQPAVIPSNTGELINTHIIDVRIIKISTFKTR